MWGCVGEGVFQLDEIIGEIVIAVGTCGFGNFPPPCYTRLMKVVRAGEMYHCGLCMGCDVL